MFFKAILGVLLAIVGYFLFIGIKSVLYPADVVAATLSENAWWGARRPESIIDDKIHPFTITTSASVSTIKSFTKTKLAKETSWSAQTANIGLILLYYLTEKECF